MAWIWTKVTQGENESYNITAEETTDPENPIIFTQNVNKDRFDYGLIIITLQEYVDKLNANLADEAAKLANIIANADISGVS